MTPMPATSQRLLVMPDDGAKAVVELIDQAREQLLLKQFKLQSELVEQALRRAEVRENLREYQMEVIRSGMPPLPIPLTEEMDAQLVAEGVLPPVGEEQ